MPPVFVFLKVGVHVLEVVGEMRIPNTIMVLLSETSPSWKKGPPLPRVHVKNTPWTPFHICLKWPKTTIMWLTQWRRWDGGWSFHGQVQRCHQEIVRRGDVGAGEQHCVPSIGRCVLEEGHRRLDVSLRRLEGSHRRLDRVNRRQVRRHQRLNSSLRRLFRSYLFSRLSLDCHFTFGFGPLQVQPVFVFHVSLQVDLLVENPLASSLLAWEFLPLAHAMFGKKVALQVGLLMKFPVAFRAGVQELAIGWPFQRHFLAIPDVQDADPPDSFHACGWSLWVGCWASWSYDLLHGTIWAKVWWLEFIRI